MYTESFQTLTFSHLTFSHLTFSHLTPTMESSSTKKSTPFQRSISPSARFCSSSISSSISLLTRPASPTRVILPGYGPSSPSIRFSTPPSRSIALNKSPTRKPIPTRKKTCMCSPTTHPGSFRCSLHKNNNTNNRYINNNNNQTSYHSNRLYARRSAMTNSLVRIGTVEGNLVRRALAALIRPSSHQQRRRADFRPRPSRLSLMSRAEEEL